MYLWQGQNLNQVLPRWKYNTPLSKKEMLSRALRMIVIIGSFRKPTSTDRKWSECLVYEKMLLSLLPSTDDRSVKLDTWGISCFSLLILMLHLFIHWILEEKVHEQVSALQRNSYLIFLNSSYILKLQSN